VRIPQFRRYTAGAQQNVKFDGTANIGAFATSDLNVLAFSSVDLMFLFYYQRVIILDSVNSKPMGFHSDIYFLRSTFHRDYNVCRS